jgi:GlcNAc-PI de-N-acetylase/NPCBM-associated, NEW3 domain of alpha-galactosidase
MILFKRAWFARLMAAALALMPLIYLERPAGAQMRVRPLDLEDGDVALGLVLRHLHNTGVFMQATAHPDDETNALHVMLNRGQGVRTILATATRGDGGQNEIGPEIFDALAVLRTEELAALHRFDATEQYFTRAVDFGYSFSIDETLQKWGHDEILGDYVRLIRTTRPDVMLGMSPVANSGGFHHNTSGLLSREAFKAAADPTKFPEQIREGLRPWQPRKYYYPGGGGPGGGRGARAGGPPAADALTGVKTAVVDASVYDVLLGRTYSEIGTEERSMHKCQGMAQLLTLPTAGAAQRFLLMDTFATEPAGDEHSLFDGIDTTVPGLAVLTQGQAAPALTTGLREIADAVAAAQKQFDAEGPYGAAAALVAGLNSTRALRQQLGAMGLSDDARFNIDARLKTKEDEFAQGVMLAHGVRLEVLADDGVVVPGESVRVSVVLGDRGPRPVTIRSVAFDGFEGTGACATQTINQGGAIRCDAPLKIPADARTTKPYWKVLPNFARYEFEPDAPFGLPFRPTPFRARVTIDASGADLVVDVPVQYRYEGASLEGEKRMELTVVPKLALRATPDVAIDPAGRGTNPASVEREIRVRVTNDDKGATSGEVRLEVPAGWRVTPPTAPVNFTREDEELTVRFMVRPAVSTTLGQYTVKALATVGTQTFNTGFQVVEYPHTRRRQLEIAAAVSFKVMDVRVAPNLTVGYVMGSGDEVPTALRQLGAKVEMLDADELAWGDLSRFGAIVTGVRAYEKRPDLAANNQRLLDYATKGGTVIVQYNRHDRSGFNDAQYGPYPARVTINRVTDENGEVQILAGDNPAFHYPNEIGAAVWKGWVQERGTYFLETQDPHYVDLLQVYEPFDNNKGWKKGALVEAAVGKGHWTYVGLGLWRQLAAGTDGSYQMMANLISRGKLPGAAR